MDHIVPEYTKRYIAIIKWQILSLKATIIRSNKHATQFHSPNEHIQTVYKVYGNNLAWPKSKLDHIYFKKYN